MPICLPTDDFPTANQRHSINGYMFCHLPGLAAARGTTVRFLLLGLGSSVDVHAPAFTGQVLQGQSSAAATAQLMPAVTAAVDVAMEQAGSWPVYCQVEEHWAGGMRATLVVR